jgi:hypothetical protein
MRLVLVDCPASVPVPAADKLPHRSWEVILVHDVVAVADGRRLVPRDLHGRPFRHAARTRLRTAVRRQSCGSCPELLQPRRRSATPSGTPVSAPHSYGRCAGRRHPPAAVAHAPATAPRSSPPVPAGARMAGSALRRSSSAPARAEAFRRSTCDHWSGRISDCTRQPMPTHPCGDALAGRPRARGLPLKSMRRRQHTTDGPGRHPIQNHQVNGLDAFNSAPGPPLPSNIVRASAIAPDQFRRPVRTEQPRLAHLTIEP